MRSWRAACVQVAACIALASMLGACAPAFSPVRPGPASAGASTVPRACPPVPIVPPDAPAASSAAPPITYVPPESPATTAPLRSPSPPVAVEPAEPSPSAPIAAPPSAPGGQFSPQLPDTSVSATESRTQKDRPASLPAHFKVALVLPLESAAFGKAAQAVAAGFEAAAQAAQVDVAVIGHGDGGVLEAFAKARADASVIVGPLVRDDLKEVTSAAGTLPWTVALNQLEDGTPLPQRMYTLALSIESEGRQIARRMHEDGVREVAIVAGESVLQRRFVASFTSEWVLGGGGPPRNFRLLRGTENLLALRAEMARAPIDAVLLAADAPEAAAAKPFLPHVSVYASSQVDERQPREVVNDLDGIRFVELPWIVDGPSTFPDLPARDWLDATLDRLYALGYDACHVALAFADGAPQRLELDGATGHLSLGPDHRIAREARLVQLEAGRPVPVEGP